MNNIEYLKYSLILMGQYNSTLDLDLTVHKWNRQEPPNNWTTYPPKNIHYYNGNRFFKVSRGFYPQFTKGYLWGRYENEQYYKDLGYIKNELGDWVIKEVDQERAF